MSKGATKDPDESPDSLTQDDFEEPLELALDRKWEKAASKLAGTLAGAWGGPLAGVAAEHVATFALGLFRASPATRRFLDEGQKWDDEQAKDQALLQARADFVEAVRKAVREAAETGSCGTQREVVQALKSLERAFDRIAREPLVQARRALVSYREWLIARHDAMPGLFAAAKHVSRLSTVFVEPELCRDELGRLRGCSAAVEAREAEFEAALRARGGVSLRTLVELSSQERASRWVVLGEPGAGKSTLARHLAWELASQPSSPCDEPRGLWPEWRPASGTARPPQQVPSPPEGAATLAEKTAPLGAWRGPVPVYLELPAVVPQAKHANGLNPFDAAEEQLAAARDGAEACEGLARELGQRSKRLGGVWLLRRGPREASTPHDLGQPSRIPERRGAQRWAPRGPGGGLGGGLGATEAAAPVCWFEANRGSLALPSPPVR